MRSTNEDKLTMESPNVLTGDEITTLYKAFDSLGYTFDIDFVRAKSREDYHVFTAYVFKAGTQKTKGNVFVYRNSIALLRTLNELLQECKVADFLGCPVYTTQDPTGKVLAYWLDGEAYTNYLKSQA